MPVLPLLPDFDESDFGAIAIAFQHAPALPLRQAWLPRSEENFRAGTVRLGRRETALLCFAHLEDRSIFGEATGDHQRLWELGDVFEIFLRDPARPEYLELHVTPFGHRLQLRYPSAQAFAELRKKGDPLSCLVREPVFDFSVRPVVSGWEVFSRVPLAAISPGPIRELLVSFSRYDYGSKSEPPVLSSTSPHTVCDFHRQDEWTRFSPA